MRAGMDSIRYRRRLSADRHIQNLALVGFMGVGKSTVGRHLANELEFEFVDTDEIIEERTGMPISEIFAKHGEAAFRDLERKLIEEMKEWHGKVIATGGGLVAQPGNLDALKESALVVCLWAGPDTIHNRTKHQSHRPILQTEDPEAKIRELLAEREPFYKQADLLISTELRPVREIAGNVAHHFRRTQEGNGTSES